MVKQVARATANVLLFYWNNIAQDTRIPTWLASIGAYVAQQQIQNGSATGFTYEWETETPTTADIINDEWYAYGPYFTELLGWLYAHTGDSAWKTLGDRVASNAGTQGGTHTELPSQKNLGEYFAGTCQSYLYYVNSGMTTPVSGAQTTQAPINLPTRVFA